MYACVKVSPYQCRLLKSRILLKAPKNQFLFSELVRPLLLGIINVIHVSCEGFAYSEIVVMEFCVPLFIVRITWRGRFNLLDTNLRYFTANPHLLSVSTYTVNQVLILDGNILQPSNRICSHFSRCNLTVCLVFMCDIVTYVKREFVCVCVRDYLLHLLLANELLVVEKIVHCQIRKQIA